MKDKVYHQHRITLPPSVVKALHLEGKTLEWEIGKLGDVYSWFEK